MISYGEAGALERTSFGQLVYSVHDLFVLNTTLLSKWSWRFASERESMWKQVIVGKFG